jgi:hypothetical protein
LLTKRASQRKRISLRHSLGAATEKLNEVLSRFAFGGTDSAFEGGNVMAISTNLKLFKAIVERGFSQGDLTVADEICGERLLEHEYLARTDLPGPQILKAQIEEARGSIKNLALTIEDVVETSDTVWARSKATGYRPALRQSGGH